MYKFDDAGGIWVSFLSATYDGLYVLRVRTKPVYNSNSPYQLVLTQQSARTQTEQVIEVFGDRGLAEEAAALFMDCYESAFDWHYSFKNDRFVHEKGYEVSLAEVFALDEQTGRFIGVEGFQNELYLALIAH